MLLYYIFGLTAEEADFFKPVVTAKFTGRLKF